MNAEGTDYPGKFITDFKVVTSLPGSISYSSDGTKIVYHAKKQISGYEIYVIYIDKQNNSDGQITANSDGDCFPCWSSFDRKIVFTSKRDADFEIYIMNIDGSNQKNLTNYTAASDQYPACSKKLLINF